jgi:hypothetical protein
VSRFIEASGTVDERGHLQLDGPITAEGPRRVRVIVLLSDDQPADFLEGECLAGAARSPAFAFLGDLEEDVYTASDGRPFRDPR